MAKLRNPAEPNNSGQSIEVRVIPRASRISITQEGPALFKIRLTSPPVEGEANAQLLKVLAKRLMLAPQRISLISGEKARRKRVRIEGLDLQTISQLLTQE